MTAPVTERGGARQRNRGIGRAAVIIGVITVLARLVGFGRQVVFAHTVGTTCLGTAYTTANMVPNIIYDIVLGGALASVVVPVLAGPAGLAGLAGQHRVAARQIASALLIVPFVPRDRVVLALGVGTSAGLTVAGVALLVLVRRERGAAALTGVPRAFLAGLAGGVAGAVAGSALASAVSGAEPGHAGGVLFNVGLSLLIAVLVTCVFALVVLRLDGGDLRAALSRLRAPDPARDTGDVTQ